MKIIARNILLILGFLLVTLGSAQAYTFSFDGSGTDGATGITLDHFAGSIIGDYSTIQDLGGDNKVTAGDAFYHAYTTTSDANNDGVLSVDSQDTALTINIQSAEDAGNNVQAYYNLGNLDSFYITAEGLGGEVDNVISDTTYTASYNTGTLNFYYDDSTTDRDGVGGTLDLVGTFAVTGGGTGTVDSQNGTPTLTFGLNLEAISLADNVWYDENGNDYFDLMLAGNIFVISITDGSANVQAAALTEDGDFIYASNDNGQEITVTAIPEPATLLLCGFGLLSLAGVSRKRTAIR
ncbi:MAG: hypothetical protein MI799_08290 [Desulfobacterales bacterium]|nr:hypothetical protein [Desulfobacterales bacterium]